MTDQEALDALEPAQLSLAAGTPLPRRKLGRGTLALLVLLRIYVLIAVPLIAYAFFKAL
jgi:hypothetical protein